MKRSLDQNQMFVGRGEEGGPNFKLFRGRHKWMTPNEIIFVFVIEYEFFF